MDHVAVIPSELAGPDDSMVTMQYSCWFYCGISHNRSLLLAAPEGVLLVRDTVAVEDSLQQQLQAGPVWHFGPAATPLQGRGRGGLSWVQSQNASVAPSLPLICFFLCTNHTICHRLLIINLADMFC